MRTALEAYTTTAALQVASNGGPPLQAWGRADGALMQWRRAHCTRSLRYHCWPAGDEQRGPPVHAWGRADGALMQWRCAHRTRNLHYHCCPAGDEQWGPPLQAWGRADGALMQWLLVALQFELLQHLLMDDVACGLPPRVQGVPSLRPRHTVLFLQQAKHQAYGIALHHSPLGPPLMRFSVPFWPLCPSLCNQPLA